MRSPFPLLALALASCSVPAADATPQHDVSTPYSCSTITPGYQVARVDPAIVAPWRALADATVTDVAWVVRVRLAATARVPAVVGTEERVRLQHQVLRVAERLDWLRRDNSQSAFYTTTHRSVVALVRAIAPTAAELDALGDGARPEVAAILGPRIVERATQSCAGGNSIHVMSNHGMLAFRPLRAGFTRALVAQIVAFDRAGHAQITPLVDGMELRLGDDKQSPACVVEAGDDGVLRPAALAEIHEHGPFVKRSGNGLSCAGCHVDGNTMQARDLGPFETLEVDVARDRQVDTLATQLWTRLTQPLARR